MKNAKSFNKFCKLIWTNMYYICEITLLFNQGYLTAAWAAIACTKFQIARPEFILIDLTEFILN